MFGRLPFGNVAILSRITTKVGRTRESKKHTIFLRNTQKMLKCQGLSRERWQSGRMHRFRKPARGKPLREFESPPLRSFERSEKLWRGAKHLNMLRGEIRRPCEHFMLHKIHKVYWSCKDRKAVLRGLTPSARSIKYR